MIEMADEHEREQELDRLGREVARLQAEQPLSVDLAQERARFLQASPQPSAARPLVFALAAAAACVLSVGIGAAVWHQRGAPLTFVVDAGKTGNTGVGTWLEASASEPLPVAFSDGSSLNLSAGSAGRVTSLSRAGATVTLEHGQMAVHVNPASHAHWWMNAGPFVVEVTGTRFDLSWSPDDAHLSLKLNEGKVTVSGCALGVGHRVHAGELLDTSCASVATHAAAVNALPASDPKANDPTAPSAPPSAASDSNAAQPALAALPTWRALGSAGKYEAAYQAAESAGFSEQARSANRADLLLLADVARYAGHLPDAASTYSALRSRFPGSTEAAVAVFMLGRLAADQRAAFGEAARDFQSYLNERPKGQFALEARGRLVEALHRSGDNAAARAAATDYLHRYPNGPYAAQARKLVDAAH